MSVLVDSNILLRAIELSSLLQPLVLDALALPRNQPQVLHVVPGRAGSENPYKD